ncbi:MAG: vitamin B12 dependent-methionine synthase activation domain-containing protein [Myxococcota bacterium]|jgi:hypothetical protein|nr:vitamin B12 dependent-methionine synthase activation domain-containing protein [Myxococcota bacterium]
MTEPRPLEVALRRRDVLRNLGYRGGAQPRERVGARLDDLWSTAEELLRPAGAHRLVDGAEAALAGMPEPGGRVGVAVCTIGGALEGESRRRADAGEMLDALLLDGMGSAAAEATADALDGVLCAALAAEGRHPAPRISPGYGRWDVSHQRDLLALLPAAALGIELTPGSMMVPRKSVSFAVRLLDGRPRASGGRRAAERCARCDLDDCAFRRDTGGEKS